MTWVDTNMLVVLMDRRAPLELWLRPKLDKCSGTEPNTLDRCWDLSYVTAG